MKALLIATTLKIHLKNTILSATYTVAFGLILLMVGSAYALGEREIILPELAALAVGCFVYKKGEWLAMPSRLFLVPSATALIGFIINMLAVGTAVKIAAVLIAMFLLLHFIKSSLAPALATGLLPIVTHGDSYLFMVSIVFFMGLLALLATALPTGMQRPAAVQQTPKPVTPVWPYLAVLLLWTVFCAAAGVVALAGIPPVIVVGFEAIGKRDYNKVMLGKQVIALALAAFIGAQASFYIDNYLWAGIINLAAVTALLQLLKMKMPPAYAMALLPMVLPHYSHLYFGLYVAVAATITLGSAYILVKKSARLQDEGSGI